MWIVNTRCIGLVAATCLLLSGCGGSEDAPVVFPVKGTVTQDGKPLAGARVTFMAQTKGVNGGFATTDENGMYELTNGKQKGIAPGEYKVTISQYLKPDGTPFVEKPEEGMDLQQAIEGGDVKEMLPRKYSDPVDTELKASVKAEENTIDFKLGK